MSTVVIAGVGYTDFPSMAPEVSWKEIMYKAASYASHDVRTNPCRDIDWVMTCAEPYLLQIRAHAFARQTRVNVLKGALFSDVCNLYIEPQCFVIYDKRR
jgi:hypothetical protein